jgi:hypothetical protein
VNDVFLGIIAAAVVVMAIVQVGLIVVAARAAERVTRLTTQIEQDLRPLVANLQAMTTEAARATAIAAAQVERADRLFTDMSARLEQTLATVQDAVVGVTRGGAWLAGLRAAFAAFRDLRGPSRRRNTSVEEEDALFIG